jgi:hypothetical protein
MSVLPPTASFSSFLVVGFTMTTLAGATRWSHARCREDDTESLPGSKARPLRRSWCSGHGQVNSVIFIFYIAFTCFRCQARTGIHNTLPCINHIMRMYPVVNAISTFLATWLHNNPSTFTTCSQGDDQYGGANCATIPHTFLTTTFTRIRRQGTGTVARGRRRSQLCLPMPLHHGVTSRKSL